MAEKRMTYEESLLQDVMSEAVWRAIQRERILLARKMRKHLRRDARRQARKLKRAESFSAVAEKS